MERGITAYFIHFYCTSKSAIP